MCQESSFGWDGFSLYQLQWTLPMSQLCWLQRAAVLRMQQAPLLAACCPSLQPYLWPQMYRPAASSCSHISVLLVHTGADVDPCWGGEWPARDRVVAASKQEEPGCQMSQRLCAGRGCEESRAERKAKGDPREQEYKSPGIIKVREWVLWCFAWGDWFCHQEQWFACQPFRMVVFWRKLVLKITLQLVGSTPTLAHKIFYL